MTLYTGIYRHYIKVYTDIIYKYILTLCKAKIRCDWCGQKPKKTDTHRCWIQLNRLSYINRTVQTTCSYLLNKYRRSTVQFLLLPSSIYFPLSSSNFTSPWKLTIKTTQFTTRAVHNSPHMITWKLIPNGIQCLQRLANCWDPSRK
jgi:hypothetical protein